MILWHNPRCSKSRQTLALLQQHGQSPEIRLYLQDPPTVAEITRACAALGLDPRALIRKGEAPYKDLSLAGASDEVLIAAMAAHPILIERPILFHGVRAAIGRPPEAVLAIL